MAENVSDLMEPLLQQAEHQHSSAIPFSNDMAQPLTTTVYGTPPFSISPILGTSPDALYEHPGGAEVLFLNLNENTVFDKVQSRRGGRGRMRVFGGVVEMVCKTPVQIMCIKAFVSREREAAILHGDENGWVELPVIMGKINDVEESIGSYQQFFSVDLDSVYSGPSKPVYELSKVEMETRNQFQLSIQVQYIGGLGYQEFKSVPFHMRTKPRKRKLEDDHESSLHSPDASRIRHENEMESPLYSSVSSNSGDSGSVEFDRVRILDHLEAKRASIDHLTFRVMTSPRNADIGYHFGLKDPDVWEDFEEGDVVGFFKDQEGKTVIDLLDNNNSKDAFMAGVISRSAYIEAKQGFEKGTSDVVCVIGIVKVNCVGPIRAGERVYSSFNLDKPGTAMSESHLPPSAMVTKRGTLLGMAMEESKPKKSEEERLVKCFACIVMGIINKQVAMEIENLYDHFNIQMTIRLRKERKRARRALCVMFSILALLLTGLAALAFELFYPGSALRAHICAMGSIKNHHSTFKYFPSQNMRTFVVNGVEFPSWPALQKKLQPQLDTIPPLNATKLNTTKFHYYLNLDRCSYGGSKLATVLHLDPNKEVGGPIIYGIDHQCSRVYYYTDVYPEGWRKEKSVKYYPNRLKCYPKSSFKTK